MPTIEDLIGSAEQRLTAKLAERKTKNDELTALRAALDAGDVTVTEDTVRDVVAARSAIDAEVDALRERVTELREDKARDEALTTLQRSITPAAGRPAYDEVVRTGAEERTYAPHKERGFDNVRGQIRAGFKAGASFEQDVARAFLGDFEARTRLERHMAEERVERGQYLSRAAGTGAFAGLVVPQYLTDMYAPAAAAMRPFADVCNKHDLPPDGMTVNISRITTSTSAAIQSSENSSVSETNIDDTLLSPAVQTNAGQQTLSRQAIERGTGTEAVMLDDLYRQYATRLDSTLINQATNGLTNVATSVAYTDASPTVAEAYPKIVAALAAVEAALLDQATGENVVVMHSRRWYWLQNALSTSWPIISQPGILPQMLGSNYAEVYGRGLRGVLPNAAPVVVDNNIATNLGAGTNEDEIYVIDRNECHLWEDPAAPVFIRAEQTNAASLGVLFVLYGYFAYTHARYSHSQKVAGTGLVTPSYTGV